MCPELTVERVLKQVQGHREILRFLPDLTNNRYVFWNFIFVCENKFIRLWPVPKQVQFHCLKVKLEFSTLKTGFTSVYISTTEYICWW